MSRKVRAVVKLHVAWSDTWEFTHGLHDGLPLLPTKWAPKHLLATKNQLTAMGKRPGGQDPVALLYGYSKKGNCQWFAPLYLISKAKPKLAMTPRKWHALNLANLARRECKRCHRARDYVIPPTFGMCFPCVEASENPKPSNENGAEPWAA